MWITLLDVPRLHFHIFHMFLYIKVFLDGNNLIYRSFPIIYIEAIHRNHYWKPNRNRATFSVLLKNNREIKLIIYTILPPVFLNMYDTGRRWRDMEKWSEKIKTRCLYCRGPQAQHSIPRSKRQQKKTQFLQWLSPESYTPTPTITRTETQIATFLHADKNPFIGSTPLLSIYHPWNRIGSFKWDISTRRSSHRNMFSVGMLQPEATRKSPLIMRNMPFREK